MYNQRDIPQSISFEGGEIKYDGKDLSITYKNHTYSIISGSKYEGGSGTGYDVYISEVRRNYSDTGMIIAVITDDWYAAASNYGSEYKLHLFLLNGAPNKTKEESTLTKIGELEFGHSGKGFDNIKTYSLQHVEPELYLLKINNQLQYDINVSTGEFKPSNANQTPISPSFQCAESVLRIEELICRNTHVANLDLIMATLYASSTYANKRKDQHEWLRERNQCKSDICLIQSYNNRIFSLINKR